MVSEPALSLHQQDVPRPEEDRGGHRVQAGASDEKYRGLAQTDGEERGREVVFTVISVACKQQEINFSYAMTSS